MAEITRSRTGELLRLVFEVLMAAEKPVRASKVLSKVRGMTKLTDYEKGEFDSGGIRVDTIIRFATVDCVKAGWMLKEKGRWSVTEEGIVAYNQYSNPEKFYREAVKLYHKWKKGQLGENESEAEREVKEVTITIEKADELAWKEIEDYLKSMDPYEFQELVASLLKAMGYHVSWISPKGKDGGLDILAWSDPLGTKPPRIKVQVKRYESNINVDSVRSFMALLGDDDVGIFVTTSDFTRDAKDEARTQEKRKITLIGLAKFVELWIEYYANLDDLARRKFPLQPIYFLSPNQ